MATQTIYTTKDTHDKQESPDANYGGINEVVISNDTGGTGDHRRGFWGFDITSAPLAGDVTNVLLYLYCEDSHNTTPLYGRFRRLTGSWTEMGLTWNFGVSYTTANQVLRTFPAAASGWYSTDITAMYKDAKNISNELGIRLYGTINSVAWASFWSRQYNSGTYKAYISITHGYYVKTTGDDALTGDSWANAWATINKAATTVLDGSTVHIGFGDYLSEPTANKIAPQNAGTTGIKYLCETPGSSGGVGTVKIEKN